MSVIFLLIPLSIAIAACFLGAFIWAVRSGQYEDTLTPSMRVLLEETRTDGTSCQPAAPGDLPGGARGRIAMTTTLDHPALTPHSDGHGLGACSNEMDQSLLRPAAAKISSLINS